MVRSPTLQRMLALASLVLLSAESAGGAELTFKMKGGDFAVSGQLRAFDGSKYTVDSESFGTILLDAKRFDCVGQTCPSGPFVAKSGTLPVVTAPRIIISGADAIGEQLMPQLIQAYARSIGSKAIRLIDGDPADKKYRLTFPGDVEVATIEVRQQGTTIGFQELEKKTAHIVMASRAVSAIVASSWYRPAANRARPSR